MDYTTTETSEDLRRAQELKQLALATAEGLLRIYGARAPVRAREIVARMEKLKDEKGAVLWREIAEAVRTMSS